MDRLGIEPSPSRMLSGCDTTTPTAPELSRPRVLKYPLRIAFSAEAVQKETKGARRQQKGRLEAERAGPHSFAHSKGVRRQQKGSKKVGRAGRDRASALKTVPCRCLSAFPGRARLPTAKRGHSNATLGTRPRRSRLPAHSFGSCSLRRSKCGLQARWTRSCSCWSRPGDR